MDLRQMQYFVSVAQTLNFTKAAQMMYVAQPAVSKAIQKLEAELGLTLIHRSDKRISLTPEGQVFLNHCISLLEKLDEIKLEMQELRNLEIGEVRIGLPSMFGSYHFPPIIKAFKQSYPGLSFTVIEEGTVQIRKLIENKELDLGVIAMDDEIPGSLNVIPIIKEEVVVCFPPNHLFNRQPSIPYHLLLQEPLILFKEGYFQRKLIEQAKDNTGIQPNISLSSNQLSLVKSLVAEGLGITMFLKIVADKEPALSFRSLDPPVCLNLGIAWVKDRYLSKASRAFLKFLQS